MRIKLKWGGKEVKWGRGVDRSRAIGYFIYLSLPSYVSLFVIKSAVTQNEMNDTILKPR